MSRFPTGPPPGRSRLIAAGVAVVLAVTSFVFVRSAFDDGSNGHGPVASGPTGSSIDPAEVCDVPAYDPSIALLGDLAYPEVVLEPGPLEVPLVVLEDAGVTPEEMDGALGEALRAYVASPQAVNAPTAGWRTVVEGPDLVIMAAPEPSPMRWWVTKFVRTDVGWEGRVEEIAEQHPTPAQRGHGLELSWSGEVVLVDGAWTSTLELVNSGDEPWVDQDAGGSFAGEVAVYDPSGGQLGRTVGGGGGSVTEIGSREAVPLPITLGGALGSLGPGRFDLIACVPALGLASPVGSLVVDRDPSVEGVQVLRYPSSGAGMLALGGGTLVVHNGCLAVADRTDDPRPTYVVWPDGFALIDRGGARVLIDPTGEVEASLGDDVQLGGGFAPADSIASSLIEPLPEACTIGGEGYFLTSGTVK